VRSFFICLKPKVGQKDLLWSGIYFVVRLRFLPSFYLSLRMKDFDFVVDSFGKLAELKNTTPFIFLGYFLFRDNLYFCFRFFWSPLVYFFFLGVCCICVLVSKYTSWKIRGDLFSFGKMESPMREWEGEKLNRFGQAWFQNKWSLYNDLDSLVDHSYFIVNILFRRGRTTSG